MVFRILKTLSQNYFFFGVLFLLSRILCVPCFKSSFSKPTKSGLYGFITNNFPQTVMWSENKWYISLISFLCSSCFWIQDSQTDDNQPVRLNESPNSGTMKRHTLFCLEASALGCYCWSTRRSVSRACCSVVLWVLSGFRSCRERAGGNIQRPRLRRDGPDQ